MVKGTGRLDRLVTATGTDRLDRLVTVTGTVRLDRLVTGTVKQNIIGIPKMINKFNVI